MYDNTLDINTALVASANGGSILAAQANGSVLLYNANADTFTISQKGIGGIEWGVRGFEL